MNNRGEHHSRLRPDPGGRVATTAMTAEADDQLRAMVAGNSMLSRFRQQPELGSALLFLASPASSYVTGTSLLVDEGMAAL